MGTFSGDFSVGASITPSAGIQPSKLTAHSATPNIAPMERASDESGINFRAREPRFEIVNDEYGKESLQVRIYWYGPHTLQGDPRAIRPDISAAGKPSCSIQWNGRSPIPNSDAPDMDEMSWRCYALEEVMAEKLRAVLGQRKQLGASM